MTRHRLLAAAAVVAGWILTPSAAQAHRLDEYLQATRLSIDVDRVGLEIDLTPGVTIARDVFNAIDADGDGWISAAEKEAYAREVLRSIVLSVDGRAAAIVHAEIGVPEFGELAEGVGTIRVRAAADIPYAGAGHHRLAYANVHKADTSVYLVNALVPGDPRIQISAQERDGAQHRLTLDYEVAGGLASARTWSLLAALMMAGTLGVTRRRARV